MGGQPARGLPRYSADTVVVDLFGRTGNTGAARRGIKLRGFHGWRRIGFTTKGRGRGEGNGGEETEGRARRGGGQNKDEERGGTAKGRGHAY